MIELINESEGSRGGVVESVKQLNESRLGVPSSLQPLQYAPVNLDLLLDCFWRDLLEELDDHWLARHHMHPFEHTC